MPFRRVMAARGPIQNMQLGIEWPDGRRRILNVNGAPLFGANGETTGVVFLVIDITQRMSDERILRDSEKRFRLMVEGLPSGAVFVDMDSGSIYLNHAAETITGYTRNELTTVDQWFWALYGESSEEARAKYERIRDMGFTEICVGTIHRKDGNLRVIESSGYRSESALVWLLRDVTDHARVSEDCERLQTHLFQSQSLESLAIIAEGMAHDCNNALEVIVGATDVAQHELPNGDELREFIDAIAKSAERAATLFKEMMAYASDSLPQIAGTVDVNSAVHDTVRYMRAPVGGALGVAIQIDLDEKIRHAQMDGRQFRRALLAVLKNAAEAAAEGDGTVSVATFALKLGDPADNGYWIAAGLPPGDYVGIRVVDSGIGMESETLSKVFTPFFTTKPGARGLGLSDALRAVRASNGEILIDSGIDVGTTATILLPVEEAAGQAVGEEDVPSPLWHGAGTILVVDDELNVRTITKRMLEKLGFEVVLAASGYEAVEQVAKDPELAAVILDMTMPNMDGSATFDKIRHTRPHLPVFIASGYDTNKIAHRFSPGSIAGFLQKPFPLRTLSANLREALRVSSPSGQG